MSPEDLEAEAEKGAESMRSALKGYRMAAVLLMSVKKGGGNMSIGQVCNLLEEVGAAYFGDMWEGPGVWEGEKGCNEG